MWRTTTLSAFAYKNMFVSGMHRDGMLENSTGTEKSMAICEISNGMIAVSVESRGAELKSLRRVDGDKEYMWSGDGAYWGRTSPLLFPLVGGLKDGKYRYKGNTYTMAKHGIVREAEFKIMSHDESEIWFVLVADEETKKGYPFDFRLEVGYRLEENRVKVLWRVENPSEEIIYFSIGGHPGFNCPINQGESRDDYYIAFDAQECIRCTVIGDDGLASDHRIIYELEEGGLLPVREELFEKDALIMEDNQVHSISFLTPDKKPYIRVDFDMPVVAVWTMAGKNAPFICVEPWCGICDHTNFTGTLEERKWGNQVEPGKRFAKEYSITIED